MINMPIMMSRMKNVSAEYISTTCCACLLLGLLAGCATVRPESPVPVAVPETPPVEEPLAEDEPERVSPVESSAPEEQTGTVKPPAKVVPYKRDDVLWIQQRLQELGYYNGAVDGAVGAATRAAVRAYQRDQDIKDDGRPTAKLREFMWRNGG